MKMPAVSSLTRSLRPLVLVMAVTVGALAFAGSASAQCYSSTASQQSFSDSPVDGDSGLAPEILGAVAVVGSNCSFGAGTVIAGVQNPGDLLSGESVGMYFDTDGNPATGDTIF